MAKLIKNSFNAGEFSETLAGRTDIAKYYNACSVLVNGIVMSEGGIVKRPGTKYIATAKGITRLIPFEFSATDTMMLEFSDSLLRFYKTNDRVMTASKTVLAVTLPSGSPVAITTSTAHGFATGKVVRFTSLNGGVTALNYNGNSATEWTITLDGVSPTTKFSLDGTDGDDYTAWTNTGTVAAIYEIVSPYDKTDIFDVHYVQSADVVYLSHEDYPTQKLSRLADNSWTIAAVVFEKGPFLPENTNSAYLMGFARTGGTARSGYYFPAGTTGTLLASGTGNTPFLATHNPSLWRISHTRPDNVLSTPDNSTNAAPSGAGIRIKGAWSFDISNFTTSTFSAKIWRKKGNGSWQEYKHFGAATAYSSTEEEDDVYYTWTESNAALVGVLTAENQINHGIVLITGHTNTTLLSCTVVEPVLSNNSSDVAVTTSMWAEGAWSEYRGYPKAITFFEDRLWAGGSANNPQTLWSSKSSDYENFETDIYDDNAVISTINDADVSQIQWIAGEDWLLVGTVKKEYKVSAFNPDDPIAPSDVKIRAQSSNGSLNIQPAFLNNSMFYFQGQGRRLRAMRFDYTTEKYSSDDATILARHILESTPVQMAAQRIPDAILWVVRDDGALLSFSYEPKEEVTAWARHFTGSTLYIPVGFFESVAVIRGSTEDDIWVVVRRTINSSTVRYIEKFSTRIYDQLDDVLMLDCAKIDESNYTSQDIVLASDTVRYDEGIYGSSLYGGTV